MEQGVSIYTHKAKAKEQLLDNGFPATSLGVLKGRDKSRARSEQLSSCRGRNSSETRYLPSMTFVGLMGISWAGGLKVFGTWRGSSILHTSGFSATPQLLFQFSLWLRADSFAGEKKWTEKRGLTFLTWLLWVISISLPHLWQSWHCNSRRESLLLLSCQKLSALLLPHRVKILSPQLRIHSLVQLGVEAWGSITHNLQRQRMAPKSPSLGLFWG